VDRQLAQQKETNAVALSTNRPWLGTNLCLQADHQFLGVLDALAHDRYETAQQLLSWNNLPILNEWKRLFPSRDPVQVHEQFWQTKLLCPGGGKYVWNEKWHTMESTVYGHPGEPKSEGAMTTPFGRFTNANLGLNFEAQGLSARMEIER
jgi:hypothetical protein